MALGRALVQTQHLTVDRLHIVFKVVERCNINCTYCYYFNMGDKTPLQRPPVVSIDSAACVANWLVAGCRELKIKEILISFHGGEPMMLNPEKFDSICCVFKERLGQTVDVHFGVQTNGTILTDKWLSILSKHRVNVGVSIDGGRTAHDRYRLDHQGRSTFERTEQNLKELVKAAKDCLPNDISPSTISVIDCRNDYTEVYRYLRGLGVRRMSFLLPDRNFDDGFIGSEETPRKYGESLFRLFEAWMTEDNPGVEVRFISDFLRKLRVREEDIPVPPNKQRIFLTKKKWTRQVLIIHSDGIASVSDSYIPALPWYRNTPQCDVRDTSLRDFLMNGIFDEIECATRSLSAKCQPCRWRRICKGGDIENRFSRENGFNNPSVYCESYLFFFQNACNLLVENGYPADYIQEIVAN
ncbi:radical SAM protein [Bradyrhizobium sp. HKCCYLRH2015]|uniref:radical SAM protein n=1 Tax=unclassified Bradyrhizobium TaxID=2631580 RepID=UPI0028EFC385|nr:radical SAM protein [Bradyrhizobium sp. SZCCHNS3002]